MEACAWPWGGTYMDHSGGSREMDLFMELLNDVKFEDNNATDCLSLILGGASVYLVASLYDL